MVKRHGTGDARTKANVTIAVTENGQNVTDTPSDRGVWDSKKRVGEAVRMSEKRFWITMWVTVMLAVVVTVLSEMGILQKGGWLSTAVIMLIAPLLISVYHLAFIAPHTYRLLQRNIDLELRVELLLKHEVEYQNQIRQSQTLLRNLTAGTRKQTRKEMSLDFIYFIVDRAGGKIKIGISNDPDKRLAALQTANGNRLEMIHTVQGDVALEQSFHKKFEHLHMSGEWFVVGREIQSFIEQLKEQSS